MATIDQPIYESVAAYHADYDRISNTMLKCFARSRREYEGLYVKRERKPDPPTGSQNVGTLTHADLLGEGDVSRFVVSPFENFKKQVARDWRDEQLNEGREIVTEEQLADVKACVESVRSKIGRLLDDDRGRSETYHQWQHADSGLDQRCMVDFHVVLSDKIIAPELKTCADETPRGFRKACEDWDYPIQQVHYTAGLESTYGLPVEWMFVAVRNNWPYTCRVYQLDEFTLDKAREARDGRLRDLADCYASGDWSEPGEHEITTLRCRDYYLKEEIK